MIVDVGGQRYDFPDDATDAEINAAIGPAKPAAPMEKPSVGLGATALDIAKQIPSGLVAGVEGVAAAPAHIANLTGKALDYIAPNLSDPGRAQEQATLKALIEKNRGGGIAQYLPKPATTAGEYARTASEFVPSFAGLAGTARGALGAAATGAASGLVSEAGGQATKGTEAEPYVRAALGAATPFGIAGLRRAVTPLPMRAADIPYVNTLQAEGVPLSAGAITGSKPLQTLEQTLGNVPGAGRAGAASLEQTGEGFTRAALRRVGEDAPRATPEVIDRAFTRIGNQFDTLAARNTLRPDQQFGRDVQATLGDYRNLVSPPNRAPLIENFEAEIGSQIARHNGVLPGEAYQSLSSRLERAARGAAAQPEVAMTLRDLRGALDRAMERGLAQSGSPDLGAWRQARTQYRNMLTIERAATAAGSETAKGLISPSALRNATVVKQGRRNYGRGEGDFADLARAGEAVLKPLPTSGTSERTYAQHLPAVMATLLGSLFGGAPGAALGAGAALAGPPIAGRLLHSRLAQAYLRNQALARPSVGLLPKAALGGTLPLSLPQYR
jgi:hypothetical protein